MTHDPLCAYDETRESPCDWCDLIARVREDERGKTYEDWDWPAFLVRARAREEALRDAVEAVKSETKAGPLFSVRNSGDPQRGWDAAVRHAIAAIEALGGER